MGSWPWGEAGEGVAPGGVAPDWDSEPMGPGIRAEGCISF